MDKWQYIRRISQLGCKCRVDAVLMLLEWCDRPNTCAVTEDEAREFFEIMCRKYLDRE